MSGLLRVEVREEGREPLPAIHVAPPFIIGSSLNARVRLPANVAQPEHVRVDANRYTLDGTTHDIGTGTTLELGAYRVTLAPAAADAVPTPPQRTESLARELMRSLLGTAGAPTLEIVSGSLAGAKRPLQPPDSTLVIGRGDEANWIIADDDLSRTHAEIRRTLDGITIVDLDSKNGTKVDGKSIDEHILRDGARILLGKLAFVFRDPSEQQLAALISSPPPAEAAQRSRSASGSPRQRSQRRESSSGDEPRTRGEGEPRAHGEGKPRVRSNDPRARRGDQPSTRGTASALPFYAAIAIMLVALGGLVWILSS